MPKSRKLRPSSTPGRTKGPNCQRSQMKNLWVNDTKLYKKPELNARAAQEVQSIQAMKGNNHTIHELVK